MFDYDEAFSRNLGWVTESEQSVLKAKRVAIAGMGGVGGAHLLTLARLGIGKFTIADLDTFELANFNRQAGAFMRTLGEPKIDSMAAMAWQINPTLEIARFEEGVDADNMDAFLRDVDLYVDALDFFAFDARRAVFAACAQRGIPAITAAPLGMGAALLCFMPGKMSFEDYFRLEGQPREEQALRLMLGLSPTLLHMRYLVDDSRVDFAAGKGPSTPMACEMCAGVAASHALKILLNRGDVPCAPRGVHYDAFRNRISHTWRPWGNANPIQKLGLAIARKRVMGKAATAADESDTAALPDTAVHRVLDLARWAPSGDNEQPWRFELVDEQRFIIRAHDTRQWCLYDLDGRSSQVALGALVETIAIAAGGENLHAAFTQLPDSSEERPVLEVRLQPVDTAYRDELLPYIRARVTQRRPFTRRTLLSAHREALSQVVGRGYRVVWLEGEQRMAMARLLFRSAHIRLTTPEGYAVHRQTIDWGRQFSETRIPEQAVGADVLTMKIMRWALHSWQRVKFLNRFLAGTWLPRLQMDFLTGIGCAAHFVIVADEPLRSLEDYIQGGRAMQRLWLEATRLGLQFQPEMTPLIFSRYHHAGLTFTSVASEQRLAGDIAARLSALTGTHVDPRCRVYMGRVGYGHAPQSRSIRPPLEQLLVTSSSTSASTSSSTRAADGALAESVEPFVGNG